MNIKISGRPVVGYPLTVHDHLLDFSGHDAYVCAHATNSEK